MNVIIINLLKDKDRLERTLNRLDQLSSNVKNLSLKVYLMPAFDPTNMPKSWIDLRLKFKKRHLSLNELACASSHIKAIKAASLANCSRIIKRFYQNPCSSLFYMPVLSQPLTLIVEDDVIFHQNLAPVLKQLDQQTSLCADLLALGHHLQLYSDDGYLIPTVLKKRKLKYCGWLWAKHAGMSVGAYCYLIDIKGAKALLKDALPIKRPADWLTHNNANINALFASYALASCEYQSSSTQAAFNNKAKSLFRKRFKRCKFAIKFFFSQYF